jgi:hypothetical protein
VRFIVCLILPLLTAASSAALEPTPLGSTTTKLVRLHVVSKDSVTTLVVEVNQESFDKMPITTKATLSAATYRLTADSTKCAAFQHVGQAFKASATQLGLLLDKSVQETSKLVAERLNSSDALKRHALLFYPQKTRDAELSFSDKLVKDFAETMQPRIDNGGLIAYPVQMGFSPLATTCKCKSFFGCTTDCCTNPTCEVSPIGSFCNSNDDCKKVDVLSACSCQ